MYVGNLAWETTWQELKDHMREAGDVVHVDILCEADGRSKGCGLVAYRTAEDALNAVQELNDSELMGRQIFVREDRETDDVGKGGDQVRDSKLLLVTLLAHRPCVLPRCIYPDLDCDIVAGWWYVGVCRGASGRILTDRVGGCGVEGVVWGSGVGLRWGFLVLHVNETSTVALDDWFAC